MIIRLWRHLSSRRKKQLALMQIGTIIASFFEMAGLGAVIPFLTVLSDPTPVFNSSYLQPFIVFFGIESPEMLATPITILFVSLIVISAIIRLLLLWALTKLSNLAGAELSISIYRHTLYQDYSTHVSRNSSEVINGIITKTTTVTKSVIAPVLMLISSVITIIGIAIVLLAINVVVTLTAFLGFGGLYLLTMYLTRRNLAGNSQSIADKSDLMVKALQEGLEGIREVLLNSNQKFYTELYSQSDLQMRKALWRNEMIYSSPRFLMEAVGIGLVAIFALFASLQSGGINQFLPILGAFVLGAQKLLPAIQKAYAAFSRIRGAKYSLEDVLELLDQPLPSHANLPAPNPISFKDCIELKDINFRYTKNSPWILKGISLQIPKGSVIGIVGETGCGKSTLIDIFMGLLKPTSGELLVDGKTIDNSNVRAWQRHISSVPQHIYLTDGTLEENIAFGISKNEIDFSRVKDAAHKAQISDLVEGLKDGYQTLVGERGMRLSGGQRQRVAVARAFYQQSDILVLDEATSALDDSTELAVMDAITNLNHKSMTVIIIAHRISTLSNCDMIFRLGNDFKTELLTYDELTKLNIREVQDA